MRWWPPIAFLALALILRVPFFFVDIVDWDESTFIVMGSAWADGHLPYVKLWDNKPPLCFAPFAAVVALFGKSIVAVRVLGLLCVVGAALCVWRVGEHLLSPRAGVIAGLACVVLATFASRGQATMSETIAILPLAAALWFLLVHGERSQRLGFAGACLSVAALIRLNLAVVALAALLWWVLKRRRSSWLLVAGGTAPLLLTFLPYALTGDLRLAWTSVFVAPLVYALSGLGVLAMAAPVALPGLFWWLAGATALSILVSGGGAAHYWIQIHPFSALLVGALVDAGLTRAGKAQPYVAVMACLLIPVAGVLSDARWTTAVTRMGSVHGRSLELASYLQEKKLREGELLLLADHLAYWWLDVYPPHRMATHPSSMFRPNLAQAATGRRPEGILQEIFSRPPRVIVREEYVRHLDASPAAKTLLEQELADHYTLETEISGLKVFVRTSPEFPD